MKRNLLLVLILIVSLVAVQAQELKLGLPLGHTYIVRSASYSPNGKYIVTASYDNTAKIWDIESGKLMHSLEGHTSFIFSAEFSPDSEYIATAGYDNTAKIWVVASGNLTHSLEGHSENIQSVLFSPDSKYVVTASFDNTAKIWEAESGNLLNTLEHSLPVTFAEFSPDGKRVVTASQDDTAKIWDAKSGNLLYTLEGSLFAKFSPDGRFIVTASSDSTAKKWRVENGELVSTLTGHSREVFHAEFSPNGKYIMTASRDSTAKVWSAKSGELIHHLKGHSGRIGSGKFGPNNKYIVTRSDKSAKIWEVETGELVFDLVDHKRDVVSAEFSPDGTEIVTGSMDGTAKRWDVKTGKLKQSLEGNTIPVRSAEFSFDEKYILTVSDDKRARVWEFETGKLLHQIEGVISAKISPDTTHMVTMDENHTAKIIEIESGKLINTFEGHTDRVTSVAFSPDGKFIATASSDSTAKVWDVVNGQLMHTLGDHTSKVISVAFRPDGKYVLTASEVGPAKLWNVETGNQYGNLNPGGLSAEFSPNGEYIVTSGGNSPKVWDSGGSSLWYTLEGHTWNVISAKFSPDSRRIVTTSFDRTAKVWDVENGNLMHSLEGHISQLLNADLEFSPTGKYVATCFWGDRFAKVWEVETGNLLYNLDGHSSGVISVKYSADGKYLITASDDGSYIIWDMETGAILLRQFVFNGGEMATLGSDGLFDATPGAMKLMYWTKGTEIIEFEQLKDRFYEPGLWQKKLGFSAEPLRESRGLNNINLYPDIELKHPSKNDGKLGIKLKNQGGGYGRINILINGKEVTSDARGNQFDHSSDSVSMTYDIANHPYLKPGEINTIEVSAYNQEEFLVSRPKKMYYLIDGKKEDYTPMLHAIIVGSSDYSGSELDLSFPAKDASSFASALELSAKNLLGVDKTNFRILTTDGDKNNWPSKENIKRAYTEIGKVARPYDAIVLYFAGHGTNYGGQEGDFYYLTASASNGNLKDPVIRENVSISSRELTEWIKDIPALKQVLIFDACHSGQFAEDLLERRDIRSSSEIRSLERMKDRTGMYILSGSAADAVSYEASIYGQGLLTYSLLFGMKGASLRDGKFVDVVELFQFAADKVPELAQDIGGIQKPEIRMPYGGESFDLGILESNDREKINLPSPKPLFVRSAFQNQLTFDDNLDLSDLLNQRLKSMQYDEDAKIIFIDASKFSNAFSIRGAYTQQDGKIILKANLLKDGQIIDTYDLSASNKDYLAEELLKMVVKSR